MIRKIFPPIKLYLSKSPKNDASNKTTVTPKRIGASRFIIPFFILIGLIIEAIPRTSNRFAIQEPIMFPRDISELFWYAAPTDIANSGAEVPNPTISTEIINADIAQQFLMSHLPKHLSPCKVVKLQ